jgi:predicted ATPase/DNA-binding CsgD family transcriptional regulator/tetratricopeptide (TPR) repeat protein
VGALRGNLPVALSSFVGRDDEMEQVDRGLASARVVTLTGPGGAGKSRLALEAAGRLTDRYQQGVWWVDLAVIADPGQVAPSVAAALGLTPPPGVDPIDAVADHLTDHVALVVLDCCEHLAARCAAVVHTLTCRSRTLSLLATSRAPLGIEGETVLPVPPLELPADDAPDALDGSPAVALFLARARQNGAEVSPSPAVAELCRRLDGLPLAIELAAARTRVLSPAQILDGLDDRLSLLSRTTDGPRSRHDSVWASIDWSHDLLDEPGQVLLRRLAVFAGSFDLDAVNEVCTMAPLTDGIVDVLAGLVDHSLVQVDHRGEIARYRLLDTIRRYALERLEASGEEPDTRARHLHAMIRVAEAAAPGLQGPDQVTWLDRLRRQDPDLRAARTWAIRCGHVEGHARLAAALWFYWLAIGDHDGPTRVVTHLTPPPPTVEPSVRADLLLHSGGAHLFGGDASTCRDLSDAALAIGEDLDDERIIGRAHFQRALAETSVERAVARLEAALAASRSVGDDLYASLSVSNLGFLHHALGDPAAGLGALEEGITLSRRSRNLVATANALQWLGCAQCLTGRHGRAVETLVAGLAASRAPGGEGMLTSVLLPFLGRALTDAGRFDEAAQVLDESLVVTATSGFPFARAWTRVHHCLLALALDDLEGAALHADRAVQSATANLGPMSTGAGALFTLVAAQAHAVAATVALVQDRPDRAATHIAGAAELAGETWSWPSPQILNVRSALARQSGDLGEAARLASEAVEVAVRCDLQPDAIDGIELAAATLLEMGRQRDARWLLAAVDANRDRLGLLRSPFALATCAIDARSLDAALGPAAADVASQQGARATIPEALRYLAKGRGPRGRPSFGWDSITPAELDVVALVAQGLTNPQIGQKLFISPRTVQSHLRRVFSRLGITTRGELAAEAARHGL